MPTRLVLAMVDDAAIAGTYRKNPFNFKHNILNHLSINVGGETIPNKPYELDFTTVEGHTFIRAYTDLFTTTGLIHQDRGNNISREDYYKGYTLFAFDLTPDEAITHFTPTKRGNLNIDAKFSLGLNGVVLVAYAEFQNVIEIDRHRNVSVDF